MKGWRRSFRPQSLSVSGTLAAICVLMSALGTFGALIVEDGHYVGSFTSKTGRQEDGGGTKCLSQTQVQAPVDFRVKNGKLTIRGDAVELTGANAGYQLHAWDGSVEYVRENVDGDLTMFNRSGPGSWPRDGCGRMYWFAQRNYGEVYMVDVRDDSDDGLCLPGPSMSAGCSASERRDLFRGVPAEIGWEAKPLSACDTGSGGAGFEEVVISSGCIGSQVRRGVACRDAIGTSRPWGDCDNATALPKQIPCLARTSACVASLNTTDDWSKEAGEMSGLVVPDAIAGVWEGFEVVRWFYSTITSPGAPFNDLFQRVIVEVGEEEDGISAGAARVHVHKPFRTLLNVDGVEQSSAIYWPKGNTTYYINGWHNNTLSLSTAEDPSAETDSDLAQWKWEAVPSDGEDYSVEAGSRGVSIPIAEGHPEQATRMPASTPPRSPESTVYPTWDYQVSSLRLTPGPVTYKEQDFDQCSYFAQSVTCERRRAAARCHNGDDEEVDELFCTYLDQPPADSLACTGCVRWVTGNFSDCSADCNGGTRTRSVSCLDQDDRVAGDNACGTLGAGAKPSTSEACNTLPCADWVVGSYSSCSATCGAGVRTRSVQCVDATGAIVPPAEVADRCTNPKPSSTEACEECACEPAGRAFTVETFLPPAIDDLNSRFLVTGGAADDDSLLDDDGTSVDGHDVTDVWTHAEDICPPGKEMITRSEFFCHTSSAITSMCTAIKSAAAQYSLRVGFKVADDADAPSVPYWLDHAPYNDGTEPDIELFTVDASCKFIPSSESTRAFVSKSRQSMVALCRATS